MTLPSDVNSWRPWGVHLNPRFWPSSAGRFFLAEAAQRIGEAMFVEWSGDEPGWMLHDTELPLIPDVDTAFDGNQPIQAIHDTFGPSVRKIMSVSLYHLLEMHRAPIEDWIANLVPDPDGGEPILAHNLRHLRGEGDDGPIMPDHWDKAFWQAEVQRSEMVGAKRTVPLIASRIVNLAQNGAIGTFARPYCGGIAVELPPSAWEIDDGMRRLATCTINPVQPFDATVESTHFIFVEADSLSAALADIEQVCLVDTSDIALGGSEDDQDTHSGNVVPIRSTGAAEVECRQWLVERFGDAGTSRQTKEMFKAEALKRSGGRLSGKGFTRAWDAAVSQFPERGRPGPRGG